jgi:hypothetical protein
MDPTEPAFLQPRVYRLDRMGSILVEESQVRRKAQSDRQRSVGGTYLKSYEI